jgi:hypothetical protein
MARWTSDVVTVWDFTPETWRPFVEATINDFNAVLPASVPRLVHAPMGELACDALPASGRKGGITICVAPDPRRAGFPLVGGATTRMTTLGSVISRARVKMLASCPTSYLPCLLCHEMMHAVCDAPDAGATFPEPVESCIRSTWNKLGSWDVAYARRVYELASDHG